MAPARKHCLKTATRLMAPANEGVAGGPCFLSCYSGTFGDTAMKSADDTLVRLRCAVTLVRKDAVLPVQRHDHGDCVQAGGRPHPYDSMGSCARRETREETGLDVQPAGRAPAAEVNGRPTRRRRVELPRGAVGFDTEVRVTGEPGRQPRWVCWKEGVALRRPIAVSLPDLARRIAAYARYPGTLRRPERPVI